MKTTIGIPCNDYLYTPKTQHDRITFRFVTDDTIKTEDDIRNYFGVTVLAVVPLHEEEEQGKHHHRHRRHWL